MKRLDQLRAVKAYRDNHENFDDIDKALAEEERLYAAKFLREELYIFLSERLSSLSVPVDYAVKFSPESGLTITMPEDEIHSEVAFEPTLQNQQTEQTGTTPTKRWPNALRVTYPNGEEIFFPRAIDTLVEVINRVGPERVAALRREIANGRQLVSRDNQNDAKYKALNDGWYVWSNTGTSAKAEQIRDISNVFRLSLEVEEMPRPRQNR